VSVHSLHVAVEDEQELVTTEDGANTLEYAVMLAVACAIAGVLLVIVQGDFFSHWMTGIIKSALDLFK
jgi:hypothetical protein